MAYTINLYPSGDISFRHVSSSGSTGYNMINESEPDGGSTYIEQELTTSNSTVTSQFNCAAASNDSSRPTGKIRVRSVKVETYWGSMGQNVNTVSGTLTTSVGFGSGNYTAARTTDTRNSTSSTANYTLTTSEFSNLSVVGQTFENIDALNAKLQLSTAGRYTTN